MAVVHPTVHGKALVLERWAVLRVSWVEHQDARVVDVHGHPLPRFHIGPALAVPAHHRAVAGQFLPRDFRERLGVRTLRRLGLYGLPAVLVVAGRRRAPVLGIELNHEVPGHLVPDEDRSVRAGDERLEAGDVRVLPERIELQPGAVVDPEAAQDARRSFVVLPHKDPAAGAFRHVEEMVAPAGRGAPRRAGQRRRKLQVAPTVSVQNVHPEGVHEEELAGRVLQHARGKRGVEILLLGDRLAVLRPPISRHPRRRPVLRELPRAHVGAADVVLGHFPEAVPAVEAEQEAVVGQIERISGKPGTHQNPFRRRTDVARPLDNHEPRTAAAVDKRIVVAVQVLPADRPKHRRPGGIGRLRGFGLRWQRPGKDGLGGPLGAGASADGRPPHKDREYNDSHGRTPAMEHVSNVPRTSAVGHVSIVPRTMQACATHCLRDP